MTERPNGPTKEETEEVVRKIEDYMADLRSEKALYMSRCRPLHEAIKDTIQEAVDSKGFDRKALKVGVKQRDYLRKMQALENELDEVTQTALDRLQSQLGTFVDLPLGQAAVDRAKADGSKRRRAKRDTLAELASDEATAAE